MGQGQTLSDDSRIASSPESPACHGAARDLQRLKATRIARRATYVVRRLGKIWYRCYGEGLEDEALRNEVHRDVPLGAAALTNQLGVALRSVKMRRMSAAVSSIARFVTSMTGQFACLRKISRAYAISLSMCARWP